MFRKRIFTTNVNITIAYFFNLWQDINLLIKVPLTTLVILNIWKRFVDFQFFFIYLLSINDKTLLRHIETYLWKTKFLLFEWFILKWMLLPHQLSTDFVSPTLQFVFLSCSGSIFRCSIYKTNSFLLFTYSSIKVNIRIFRRSIVAFKKISR